MAPEIAPAPPSASVSRRAFDILIWGVLATLLITGFNDAEVNKLGALLAGGHNMRTLSAQFMRPDFSDWRHYLASMWLTIQMALWGTTFAVLAAAPLGFAAARNVAPIWIQQPVRRVLDILRSVPDLVVGALFVVAVGLGPFAGVMALAVNTAGVLGKLFSESVESIEPGPVEAVRATGAAPLQEMVWGVLPQVAPMWTSFGLYRFESNARSATVLSLIGAGGIGQDLFDSINSFAFERTSAIVVVIIVAVSAVDLASQVIRTRLL
ncbi:MAG TPA: phosphonate ABC transporter, permease protein PhnE [Caulobacteraceae bacterium]